MRFLLVLFFPLCSVSAQPLFPFHDSAFVKTIALPRAEPFDTANKWRKVKTTLLYLVSDKDVYEIFGYETSLKFRDFNFSDYHILGEFTCRQCLATCDHHAGQVNCHRNRCQMSWVWSCRDNLRAFEEITIGVLPGHKQDDLDTGPNRIVTDTVIRPKDGEAHYWLTTGRGDCRARFDYRLYRDKYRPVLMLKEWNYWGGCRAGGSRRYTITFTMPAGAYTPIKRTILAEKEHRPR